MSAVRRRFGARHSNRHFLAAKVRLAAGALSVLGAGIGLASPAQASAPHYSDILPLSQVKPGMTGYGLTTFHGTTISRFEVTVIGILKKANDGHDLILIRMKGGPITERGANLIQGMSGSPIYLNGKVAGAFSMGESFPKEPVGMVTPIEDMLDAWDPSIPQSACPIFSPPAKSPSAQATHVARPGRTSRPARQPRGTRQLERCLPNSEYGCPWSLDRSTGIARVGRDLAQSDSSRRRADFPARPERARNRSAPIRGRHRCAASGDQSAVRESASCSPKTFGKWLQSRIGQSQRLWRHGHRSRPSRWQSGKSIQISSLRNSYSPARRSARSSRRATCRWARTGTITYRRGDKRTRLRASRCSDMGAAGRRRSRRPISWTSSPGCMVSHHIAGRRAGDRRRLVQDQ